MTTPHLRIVQKNNDPDDKVAARIIGVDVYDKEEVIAAAEHLLKSAKDGDIKAFAVCYLSSSGSSTGSLVTSSCDDDVHATIAGIELMKQRFILETLED
jgi:hypothetical protein